MSKVIGVSKFAHAQPIQYPPLCVEPLNEPIKHLLFHMMPLSGDHEWCWKKHVKNICDSLEQFNGKRIISIATPGTSDRKPYSCPDDVIKEFDKYDAKNIEFLFFRNKKAHREVVSFVPMLTKVQSTNPEEVVFYGHCKGITHPVDSMCHVWSDAMYETVFNNWSQVKVALEHFGTAGSFKTYGQFTTRGNHRWHYSGTFYWFRSASVFIRNWSRVDQFFYGVESWPGLLFRPQEAACLFWEVPWNTRIGPMYNMPRSQHESRLNKWRHDKLAGILPFSTNVEQYLSALKHWGVPSNF